MEGLPLNMYISSRVSFFLMSSRLLTHTGPIYGGTGLSPAQIQKYLSDGHTVVIANVMNGRHFVLLTGWTASGEFLINDAGFDRTTYSYSDFVGYRLFTLV